MILGCPAFAAKQWLSGQPRALAVLVGAPAVEARSSGEGRGLGLFTTRLIPQFSEVMKDEPTILMEPTDDLPQLHDQFLGLSQNDQKVYLTLDYHLDPARDAALHQRLLERGYPADSIAKRIQVGKIMQTNAFNVDLGSQPGPKHRALFLNVARINHSCAPNAHVNFRPPSAASSKGYMIVRTLREIQPGEEILISYFSILLPRSERQSRAEKWAFSCNCSVCDQSVPDYAAKNAVRTDLRELMKQQTAILKAQRTNTTMVQTAIQNGTALIARIGDDSTLYPSLPDIFDGLGLLEAKLLILQRRESQRRAVVAMLEQASIWEARLTGTDSPATRKRLNKLQAFAARKEASQPRVISNEKGQFEVVWDAI